MKKLTAEELIEKDGQDGRPAYVSYKGKVYDVSASQLWKEGHHMNSHRAGHDLTKFLENAPHGEEVFERVKEVGEVEEGELSKVYSSRGDVMISPPAPIKKLLGQHPHPVSVHFPIALSIAAALFTVLSVIFSSQPFRDAAFFNLGLAFLAAPFSIISGYLSWHYNYQGKWSVLFTAKIILSAILICLLGAALVTRMAGGHSPQDSLYWTYNLLVLALAPTVMALGYVGGRITFPR